MADKRISQLIERTDIANNDVLPIVASGATTTNKVTISTIQDWMQDNLDVGVTSVGITLGTSGTDVNVSGSPITTSGNITINIPDASASARGVVTTGSQTFAGVKTFSNGLSLPAVGGSNQITRIVNIGTLHEGTASLNQIGFNSGNNIYFGKGLSNGGVISWNNSTVRYYTLPDADGTLALASQLDGYVTLGTAQTITGSKTFNSRIIGQDASLTGSGSADTLEVAHTSGSGIAVDISKAGNGEGLRVAKTSGSGNAVTISGGLLSAEAVTLTGALNGTSANFTGNLASDTSVIAGQAFRSLHSGSVSTITGYNSIQGDANGFVVANTTKGFRINFPSNSSFTHTLPDASGTLALTSNLSAYLPLTGGTLTGALNGTSASFSGNVSLNLPSIGGTRELQFSYFNATNAKTIIRATGTSDFRQHLDILINTAQSDSAPTQVLRISNSGAATFSSSVTAAGRIQTRGGGDGTNQGGYLIDSVTASTASRKWLLLNDYNVFGDFAILQSTTQTGSTYTAPFYINATGNVGIGTASPTEKLHIVTPAGADFQTAINLEKAGGFGNVYLQSYYTDVPNYGLAVKVGNVTGMVVNGAGQVGIGTASPAQKLAVSDSGGVTRVLVENTGNAAAGAGLQMLVSSSGTTVGNGTIRTDNADNMQFFNIGGERMRITSGGNVLIANAGQTDGALIVGRNGNNNSILAVSDANNTSEAYFRGYSTSVSASRVIIYSNGNIVNTNNSYGAISDIKIKENITDATPKLEDLLKVKVRNYNLIGEETKQIGVIAQELEEVFPSMIDESEDFEDVEVPQLDEEGNEVLNEEGEVVTIKERVSKGTTTKSVKYSVFVPMLIKAIQEQQEIINEMRAEIDSLKNQIK